MVKSKDKIDEVLGLVSVIVLGLEIIIVWARVRLEMVIMRRRLKC